MSKPRLRWLLIAAVLVPAVVVGLAGSFAYWHLSQRSPAQSTPIPTLTPTGKVFDVTAYGATPNGSTDSMPAIQRAIDAAQAKGGGEVYFPAGNYAASGDTDRVLQGAPVSLDGAGRDSTTITEGTRGVTLFMVAADHSMVQNLTLDAFAHGGGAPLGVIASYVTVANCRILGAPDRAWPLRFAGGRGTATAVHPTYATGNVVDNLILHDYAPPADDGLDFSFQENGSISNVQHVGSRLGLFIDRNVTVTNYSFTPEPTLTGGTFGYYITDPGEHITITNFTTSGEGGKIGVIPPGDPRQTSSEITIRGERMTGGPGFQLFIGDVTDLVIDNCTLGYIRVSPNAQTQGVITNTTYAAIGKHPSPGAVVDLASPGG